LLAVAADEREIWDDWLFIKRVVDEVRETSGLHSLATDFIAFLFTHFKFPDVFEMDSPSLFLRNDRALPPPTRSLLVDEHVSEIRQCLHGRTAFCLQAMCRTLRTTPPHCLLLQSDVDGAYPLHVLCEAGQDGEVFYHLGRARVSHTPQDERTGDYHLRVLHDLRDGQGNTLLHVACYAGHAALARRLVEEGWLSVHAMNHARQSPAHVLFRHDHADNPELSRCLRVMIEAGLSLNLPDARGDSLLHRACLMACVECVEVLCEFGADIAALNNCGESPLHSAVRGGSTKVASYLLGRGGSLTLRGEFGTPADVAASLGFHTMATLMREYMKFSGEGQVAVVGNPPGMGRPARKSSPRAVSPPSSPGGPLTVISLGQSLGQSVGESIIRPALGAVIAGPPLQRHWSTTLSMNCSVCGRVLWSILGGGVCDECAHSPDLRSQAIGTDPTGGPSSAEVSVMDLDGFVLMEHSASRPLSSRLVGVSQLSAGRRRPRPGRRRAFSFPSDKPPPPERFLTPLRTTPGAGRRRSRSVQKLPSRDAKRPRVMSEQRPSAAISQTCLAFRGLRMTPSWKTFEVLQEDRIRDRFERLRWRDAEGLSYDNFREATDGVVPGSQLADRLFEVLRNPRTGEISFGDFLRASYIMTDATLAERTHFSYRLLRGSSSHLTWGIIRKAVQDVKMALLELNILVNANVEAILEKVFGGWQGEDSILSIHRFNQAMEENLALFVTLGESSRLAKISQRPRSFRPVFMGHELLPLVQTLLLAVQVSVGEGEAFVQQHNEVQLQELRYVEHLFEDGWKFDDWASPVFHSIRSLHGESKERVLESMSITKFLTGILAGQFYTLSLIRSSGRSGSFFFGSCDSRYYIKSIPLGEESLLNRITASYYQHVRRYRDTLICHIFGYLRLSKENRNFGFMLLGNVFPAGARVAKQFDLKGSTIGREIGGGVFSEGVISGKDIDFAKYQKKLRVGPEARGKLLEQLDIDTRFLCSLNITDYSLLIGVQNIEDVDGIKVVPYGADAPLSYHARPILSVDGKEVYYVSIIDILTVYDTRKFAEMHLKSIQRGYLLAPCQKISAMPPEPYRARFLTHMTTIFE